MLNVLISSEDQIRCRHHDSHSHLQREHSPYFASAPARTEQNKTKRRTLITMALPGRLILLLIPSCFLLILLCSVVEAFTPAPQSLTTFVPPKNCVPVVVFSSSNNEEEDDDDDDVDVGDTLGDWRKFRASLIDSGLPSGDDDEDDDESKNKKAAPPPKTKSASEENENLLAQQNPELANEYRSGVWAHLIAEPEVGGLLCRMPIEGELFWGSNNGYWKEKLDTMLRMEASSPGDDDDDDDDTVAHWFRMAEHMFARGLDAITLNPKHLEEHSRVLLRKYLNYKQTWQEVCLVLSHNTLGGCSEAVVINRPITTNINKALAKFLLEGPSEQQASTTISTNNINKYPLDFLDKFVQAFGSSGAVYFGGPNFATEPALLVHGISDLEGATELAPETGIYRGGLPAAVERVLDGSLQPLDFRFFIGRQIYDPKRAEQAGGTTTLLEKVREGAYKPVACARSVALKQCLGLPKPLWHEGAYCIYIHTTAGAASNQKRFDSHSFFIFWLVFAQC
jgi:hypothetical protein